MHYVRLNNELSGTDKTVMEALGWDPVPTKVVEIPGGSACAPHPLLGLGLFGQISSLISGGPQGEFYKFHWGGGIFHASTEINGAPPSASYDFELFSSGCNVLDDVTATIDNAFFAEITDMLAANDYVIGLIAKDPTDPSFTITFQTPVQGLSQSVPEPNSLSLLGLGLTFVLLSIGKGVDGRRLL